jgi:hypothetical protein
MSAARQFSSAFAPFAFALMMSGISVAGALLVLGISATAGIAAFAASPSWRDRDATPSEYAHPDVCFT